MKALKPFVLKREIGLGVELGKHRATCVNEIAVVGAAAPT